MTLRFRVRLSGTFGGCPDIIFTREALRHPCDTSAQRNRESCCRCNRAAAGTLWGQTRTLTCPRLGADGGHLTS